MRLPAGHRALARLGQSAVTPGTRPIATLTLAALLSSICPTRAPHSSISLAPAQIGSDHDEAITNPPTRNPRRSKSTLSAAPDRSVRDRSSCSRPGRAGLRHLAVRRRILVKQARRLREVLGRRPARRSPISRQRGSSVRTPEASRPSRHPFPENPKGSDAPGRTLAITERFDLISAVYGGSCFGRPPGGIRPRLDNGGTSHHEAANVFGMRT